MNDFIAKVADIKPSNIPDDDEMCYYSKIDGSYFTRVGMEDLFKKLLKRGITVELQGIPPGCHVVSIGFNPTEKKWYGWSHRAIQGFTYNDMLFDENWYPENVSNGDKRDECGFLTACENIPFRLRGSIKITNLDQAKQAAINFAEYIS